MLAGYNDLAATHPDIAAMWHTRMDKRLKPTCVRAVSRKLAWWRGEGGHVYQMAVRDRVRAKPGYCPYCSGGEEAREADKARLALGPSARKEWGRRRCLLPIGVILRILDWAAMRGSYGGCIVFDGWIYVYVDADAKNRPIGNLPQWDDLLSDLEAVFRSRFIADGGRNELQKSGDSNSRKQIVQLPSQSISAGNLVFSS